jgi:tRNA threonylcarbamoyl adenosine modification protein YeaZ|tara:strand:- start:330 stop:968 length:639 start_codon:yes stop_codon:yes gene_type:complete
MILFLDSVSPMPVFSVIEENKVIKSIQILSKNSKKISDCIIPAYFTLQNQLQVNDKIEKLVVCTGPGSFTALRVGIAFMYGLSISKNIPFIGISCADLLQLAIPKSYEKKTLMIICSSNNQNFIAISSKKSHKYLINKIDAEPHSMKIDHSQYNHCVTNSKLPSNIANILSKKNCQQINFTEIVNFNLKNILSLPVKSIVEPIYISENKLFD